MAPDDFLVRHGWWVFLVAAIIIFGLRAMIILRPGKCAGCPCCTCKCRQCVPIKTKNPQ